MRILSARLKIFGMLFGVFLILLCGIKLISSLAQTSSQANPNQWKVKKVGPKRLGVKSKTFDLSEDQERIIEDQIPAHLPIKVELKNLEIEPMLRNLEIKVTNTSDKPIYYLKLLVFLPDIVSPSGRPIAFPLSYGRADLIDFQAPLQPEDAPLHPGESCILTIPDKNKKGLDIRLSKLKLRHLDIKRVSLAFQLLNFGDKTGFSSSGGEPIPNKKSKSSNDFNQEGREAGCGPPVMLNAQLTYSSHTPFQNFTPVAFINTSDSSPQASGSGRL